MAALLVVIDQSCYLLFLKCSAIVDVTIVYLVPVHQSDGSLSFSCTELLFLCELCL